MKFKAMLTWLCNPSLFRFAVISSSIWCLLLADLAFAGPTVHNEDKDITYHGVSDDNVDQFLGIAFAEDTGGNNRFAPPKPFIPMRGSVVDATKPGPACPQPTEAIVPFMSNVTHQSENCLNLRITRPAELNLNENPLPVMVYIYGGLSR